MPEPPRDDPEEPAAGFVEGSDRPDAETRNDDVAISQPSGNISEPAVPAKTATAGGKRAATMALTATRQATSSAPKTVPSPDDLPGECTAIRRLGEKIALARAAGQSRKQAVSTAVGAGLAGNEDEADQRISFSGRVYATLIYRLDPEHDPRGYAAYAQAACFVLRGTRRIIPASPEAERALNRVIADCRSEPDDDRHTACIARGLSVVVDQYR